MASLSIPPRCLGRLWLIIALLASCGPFHNDPSPPTSLQTLNVTLWVEWPVIPYGWEQIAHVIVTNENGDRLSDSTVLGKFITTPHRSQVVVFPRTDSEGYTSLLLPNPSSGVAIDTARIEVQATWQDGYGMAWAEYQLRP